MNTILLVATIILTLFILCLAIYTIIQTRYIKNPGLFPLAERRKAKMRKEERRKAEMIAALKKTYPDFDIGAIRAAVNIGAIRAAIEEQNESA